MWKSTGRKPTCVLARTPGHLQKSPGSLFQPPPSRSLCNSDTHRGVLTVIPRLTLLIQPSWLPFPVSCPMCTLVCICAAAALDKHHQFSQIMEAPQLLLSCRENIASRAVLHLQQKLNYVMALLMIFQYLLIFLRLKSELSIWPWRPFSTSPPSPLCSVLYSRATVSLKVSLLPALCAPACDYVLSPSLHVVHLDSHSFKFGWKCTFLQGTRRASLSNMFLFHSASSWFLPKQLRNV